MRTASLRPPVDVQGAPQTPLREEGQSDPYNLVPALLNSEEFGALRPGPRKFYLHNLIGKSSITIVNAGRGVGKSLFTLHAANAITWGPGCGVGPWACDEGANVLIVDGESQVQLLQRRVAALDMGKDVSHKPHFLHIYSDSLAHNMGIAPTNLLDESWRQSAHSMIHMFDIGVVVLDNLASITPGIDENDKKEFDPVNRWLLNLRSEDVSIIMVHHMGKSGNQRGTSAHEDHVDTALCLERPRGYRDEWGCRFRVHATKDRDYIMQSPSPVLQLMTLECGRQEFAVVANTPLDMAAMMLEENPDLTVEMAREAGISRATFFRAKKELEK